MFGNKFCQILVLDLNSWEHNLIPWCTTSCTIVCQNTRDLNNICLVLMNIQWVPKKMVNQKRVNELLQQTVQTNHFTNYGPNTHYLEKLLREKLQVSKDKAIICVSNGTVALYALTAAISMQMNRTLTWSTQSFTFPASAQGYLQGTQIVDIDQDGGLELQHIETDGIIVTNVFGNVVNINKYIQWCKNNNKLLIFDNAATPYTFYNGSNAINYGIGSTISFHHTKPLGFGEGGAIIVDQKYEFDLRRCINFGIDNELDTPWHRAGSNYKMSDISAIYIIQYLEKIEHIVATHQQLYEYLKSKLPTFVSLYPNHSSSLPFVACFCILSPTFTSDTVQKLKAAGIYCRKYYTPLADTPQALQMYNSILCLPCTVDMSTKDIDDILTLLFD
jgi:dTDP-4-amino-4,6-dideoxygalactose transaminase